MMAGNEEVDVAAMTEKVMDVVMSQAMTMTLIAGILALLIYAIVFLIRRKKLFTETSIGPMPVNGILPVALVAVGFNVMVSMLLPLPRSRRAGSHLISRILLSSEMEMW